VEFAGFLIEVVFDAFAIHLFATRKVFKMNVSASFDVAGVLVVIDFVGLDLHIRCIDDSIASEMVPGTILTLDSRTDEVLILPWGVRSGSEDLFVDIWARLSGLRGGR